MAAMKMPKDTDEQKAARRAAMAEAFQNCRRRTAASAPEACAGGAARPARRPLFGNPNAASDAGSGGPTADRRGGKAASYNMRINLPGVKDEVFAAECRAENGESPQKRSPAIQQRRRQRWKRLGLEQTFVRYISGWLKVRVLDIPRHGPFVLQSTPLERRPRSRGSKDINNGLAFDLPF